MRHSVAVLFAALLAFGGAPAVRAGGLGALHRDGGFVDAPLGARLESVAGLTPIGSDAREGTETYVRRSDALRVGGVDVDRVTYSFYRGRLYFVSIQMSGPKNARGVRAALEATFGEGIATGAHPNERIWPGGSVFVLYDFDPQTGRGLAAMTSTPIHAQMRLERSAVSSATSGSP
jgi:hypothetical protein